MNSEQLNKLKKTKLVADWNTLMRTFIRPDNDATRATLVKYMEQILFGLHDFLKEHVGITEEISLKKLAVKFSDTRINEDPKEKLTDVITEFVDEIAPHAVNVASPYFIGHMTSAIPFFMVHLKTIVAALNQNVVKLETSKVVSILEKQVLAKIHRLVFNMDEEFYKEHVQSIDTTLGCFTDGGTSANLTALWVARNSLFPVKNGFNGIEADGLHAAYEAYGVERCVILVSRYGHYSLRKACGLLGIGNRNIIPVDVDKNYRLDTDHLDRTIKDIGRSEPRTKIMAVVGIAGATETGAVDNLRKIGEICSEHSIHFHADAAWGGPTMMSKKYRYLLDGIELADSVTIDGHKQFYMPMSCGMVYFKDPAKMDVVLYHANYVIRRGSVDLGKKSLAGSREANSLILDSALKIMGSRGYALLIEHGIETAEAFAAEINKRQMFELISKPNLNILTYRICPEDIQKLLENSGLEERTKINQKLNQINKALQRLQREAGNSFVSRTTIRKTKSDEEIVVLRSVIMNPMTTIEKLKEILDEQEDIYNKHLK